MNGLHIICVLELDIPYSPVSYNYIYMSGHKDIIDCMKPYLSAYKIFKKELPLWLKDICQ